jgi:cytoskeletal protein CcmA (bactofilin family)
MDLTLGKNKASSYTNSSTSEGSTVALVGPGTEFEGTLRAGAGQVCLNASFKGTAASEGTIVIDENGDVAAELTAKVISISGKLKGTAKAQEKLEIRSRGVVLGDISTPVLVVEPGGYFDGQCHMPVPAAEKPVAAKAAATREVSI